MPTDNPNGVLPESQQGGVTVSEDTLRNFRPVNPNRENPPWTFGDVIRILLVAAIALVVLGAVFIPIAARRLGVPISSPQITENPQIALPVQAAAYLVVLLFMVVILRTRHHPFWRTVQWNWPSRRWLGYILAGVILGFVIEGISAFLPIPKEVPFDKYFTSAAGAYWMAAFGVTLAPLMEEMFFRGFLYPVLNRRLGFVLSLTITSIAFSLLHAAQLAHAWAPLLLIFVVGLVLTYTRARVRSVGASFLIHAGYNSTLFALMWFATDHFRHLEKMS